MVQTAPPAFSGGTSSMHSVHLLCPGVNARVYTMLHSFRRANQIITSLWDSKLIVSIAAPARHLSAFSLSCSPALPHLLFSNVFLILSRRRQSWSDSNFLNYNCLTVLTETSRSWILLVSVLDPCLALDGLSAQ